MEAFITSIGSILSIVLLIALGYILKEKNWFSDNFSGNISKLIMNIACDQNQQVDQVNTSKREDAQ